MMHPSLHPPAFPAAAPTVAPRATRSGMPSAVAALAVLSAALLPTAALSASPGSTTLFVATSGKDSPGCGQQPASPCASVAYAVAEGGSALAAVEVAGGMYGPSSCGVTAVGPLFIRGAGSSATAVNCGGVGEFVVTAFSVSLSGLTVAGGQLLSNGAAAAAASTPTHSPLAPPASNHPRPHSPPPTAAVTITAVSARACSAVRATAAPGV
jgi:hypothetical protein